MKTPSLKKIRGFFFVLLALVFGFQNIFAAEVVLTTEDPEWQGNEFVLDVADEFSGSGNIDLKFGQSVSARFRFDGVSDKFGINRNLDLENNQLSNVRLENASSAPVCNTSVQGKIYHNTTDNMTYVCNGSIWNLLEGTGLQDGDNDTKIQVEKSADEDKIRFDTAGTERVVIDENGNVGIGIDPTKTLHVNGTAEIDDDLLVKNSTNYGGNFISYGDGSDGALTISSANTVVNDYTYLTGDEFSGGTLLEVNNSAGFSNGDEVLIVQMQNGLGGTAGQYEFAEISSTTAGSITISTGLEESYFSGSFDTSSASATQIIRVPEYTNITVNDGASITAPAWNGFTGGIVVFKANGTADFNNTGEINVDEKGFRGGTCGSCGNSDWGTQGEGTLGLGGESLAANGNGGGGGYGPSGVSGEPGAGGGCGTSGNDGLSTNNSSGGNALCGNDKIVLGGGAGAGGDNDGGSPFPEDIDGAGAAFISCQTITNINASANGEAGIAPGGAGGAAGGGAGGTILIYGDSISTGTITANGGTGGADNDDLGGSGGNGIIFTDEQIMTDNLFFTDISAGFVGIKQPNPAFELDVNGTIRGDSVALSDRRLKKNIQPLENSLEKILTLQGVSYDWKDPRKPDRQIGFIAQDIEKQFPEAVKEDQNGIKSLNYKVLVAPLFEAVKALHAQNKHYEERLEKLSQKLEQY